MTLQPLELLLEKEAQKRTQFPDPKIDYFIRYTSIKTYCEENYYKYIGAATSAKDQGIYTDHSIDHFNEVIRYAGKLLNLENLERAGDQFVLSPYEVFILLVSILLHDAGNIKGRAGHERSATKLFMDIGKGLCPDKIEAKNIGKIAQAHGGKVKDHSGDDTKDTIRALGLDEKASYRGHDYRPKLLAAIVRFADEICESRNRVPSYLIESGELPKKSEIYHCYAKTITSVDVDLPSKVVNITYDVDYNDILFKKGKDDGEQYLIDEINQRLEKMFCELSYCKSFMYSIVPIEKIRAKIVIYDDDGDEILKQDIELEETGYPSNLVSVLEKYKDWNGESVLVQCKKAKS